MTISDKRNDKDLKRVYLNEYNIAMDKTVYFPLVSGILSAYAKTFKEITSNYSFEPFIYKRDLPSNIIKKYDNPSIAAFSVSMWNYNLCLEVARLIKQRWSSCVIIFGGPSTPFNKKLPNVDHIINGEGEKKFVNILAKEIGLNTLVEETQETNLDVYPSPYIYGEYDHLLKDDVTFQAIVETNRGCVFNCAYCFWGQGGLSKKFRFHSIERVKEEAEWIGRNKIKYVFCADSNFGMFKLDIETAKIYADVKKKYGYPEKFRVCYGKNAEESIFQTAKILSESGLCKAVTLSKQTDNQEALKNIGRNNINNDVYNKLQKRYEQEGIPTYVEFIIGLPGETLESFKQGVLSAIKGNTNLFIYHCSILPNTEMDKKEYREKHGLVTVKVPITEIHCSPREEGAIQEEEEIIIGTNTMSTEEWIEATVYSWTTQLKHSLGVCADEETIKEFQSIALSIIKGFSRARYDSKFGNIYFDVEEMAYLYLTYKDGDPVEYARKNVIYRRKS